MFLRLLADLLRGKKLIPNKSRQVFSLQFDLDQGAVAMHDLTYSSIL